MSEIDFELQQASLKYAAPLIAAKTKNDDKSAPAYAVKVSFIGNSLAHGFYKGIQYCRNNKQKIDRATAEIIARSDSKLYLNQAVPGAVPDDAELIKSNFIEGFVDGTQFYRESVTEDRDTSSEHGISGATERL